jgi:hypothetical protein
MFGPMDIENDEPSAMPILQRLSENSHSVGGAEVINLAVLKRERLPHTR